MKDVRYYRDERNDDFASTNGKINRNTVDGDYRYLRTGFWWKVFSFIVYRLIVTPIVWVWVKVWLGLKVNNRAAIKALKHQGCFFYLNHTQDICDAYIPSIACFSKKTYIVTGPETVSIKGIRLLVAMLGALPLPTTYHAAKHFDEKLMQAMDEGASVTIYPEAHIWPYCNFVRDFSDVSFSYPIKQNAPVIAGVVVYRRRKIFKNAHPRATVFLSDPIWPDPDLPLRKARKKLRDEAFSFMSETAKRENSYAFIEYKKLSDDTEPEIIK